MNKRGLIIIDIGLVATIILLSIATSILPSDIAEPNDLSVPLLFEEMFNEIFDDIVLYLEIQLMSLIVYFQLMFLLCGEFK